MIRPSSCLDPKHWGLLDPSVSITPLRIHQQILWVPLFKCIQNTDLSLHLHCHLPGLSKPPLSLTGTMSVASSLDSLLWPLNLYTLFSIQRPERYCPNPPKTLMPSRRDSRAAREVLQLSPPPPCLHGIRSAPATRVSSLFLDYVRHDPAPGPLHWLYPSA